MVPEVPHFYIMSKTRCIFHIVFATKNRERTIPEHSKKELYAYIFGIIKNQNCHLIRMNGVEDHIHILLDLHPTVSLSRCVQEIKQSSSYWLRQNRILPNFIGWGKGYYAVTLGIEALAACKQYIINQEIHHRGCSFIDEVEAFAKENGLDFYPDDLA